MKKIMKSGIGALLVGGLLVSGFGVFNVGDGAVKTAEAASATKKKAGTVTYTKYLGDTDPVRGKKSFRSVNLVAKGVVNKSGSKADLQLRLVSSYNGTQTHKMKIYRLHDSVWFLEDIRNVYSDAGTSIASAPSGTYFISVESQYKNSSGKYVSYYSESETFKHSTSVK